MKQKMFLTPQSRVYLQEKVGMTEAERERQREKNPKAMPYGFIVLLKSLEAFLTLFYTITRRSILHVYSLNGKPLHLIFVLCSRWF